MIPIYVPSYNRAKTIKTSIYLDECGLDYRVLLHTEKCKEDYLNAGRVTEQKIIVTGADRGITNQRNWIVNNLAEKGKWYISLDDNISGFKRVRSPLYENNKRLDVNKRDITQSDYDFEINAKEFVDLLEKDISVAEQIKVEYIGFATVGNYFFNSKKYKNVGYVISKAVAIKYNELRYEFKDRMFKSYFQQFARGLIRVLYNFHGYFGLMFLLKLMWLRSLTQSAFWAIS